MEEKDDMAAENGSDRDRRLDHLSEFHPNGIVHDTDFLPETSSLCVFFPPHSLCVHI